MLPILENIMLIQIVRSIAGIVLEINVGPVSFRVIVVEDDLVRIRHTINKFLGEE